MTRENLVSQLVKIRELRLRNEVAALKERVETLRVIEETGGKARDAAGRAVDAPSEIRDLGALGDIRINSARRATEVSDQVRALGTQVTRARRLTDSAREAHREIGREKQDAIDRASDREAEQFLNWKRREVKGR